MRRPRELSRGGRDFRDAGKTERADQQGSGKRGVTGKLGAREGRRRVVAAVGVVAGGRGGIQTSL